MSVPRDVHQYRPGRGGGYYSHTGGAMPYYLLAVAMHAGFNYVAGLSATHPELMGEWTPVASLLIGVGFAGWAWITVRRRIETG